MNNLCILCKEPISTPLTIENVGKHIEMWLPNSLKNGFLRIVQKLKTHIERFYRVGEYGRVNEQILCIHCFVKEVYQWLENIDKALAEKFISVFSFGYSKKSFLVSNKFHPVEDLQIRDEIQFGICDECGEYSDGLEHVSGEWLCDCCSKYA